MSDEMMDAPPGRAGRPPAEEDEVTAAADLPWASLEQPVPPHQAPAKPAADPLTDPWGIKKVASAEAAQPEAEPEPTPAAAPIDVPTTSMHTVPEPTSDRIMKLPRIPSSDDEDAAEDAPAAPEAVSAPQQPPPADASPEADEPLTGEIVDDDEAPPLEATPAPLRTDLLRKLEDEERTRYNPARVLKAPKEPDPPEPALQARRALKRGVKAERQPNIPLSYVVSFTLTVFILLGGLILFLVLRLPTWLNRPDDPFGEAQPPGSGPTMPGSAAQEGRLTGAAPAGQPSGRIAFASNRAGDFDLYVLDLQTGETSVLYANLGSDERSPAWSPDGTQLIFVSNQAGNDDLYLLPGLGEAPVALTDGPQAERSPSWASDGQQLAFSQETAEGSQLFVLDLGCVQAADGCAGKALPIAGAGNDTAPSWSPGGARLAFTTSEAPGQPSKIGVLGLGGAVQQLAGTGSTDALPAWSPVGDNLAFVSFAQSSAGDYDVWWMQADGTAATRLTENASNDVEPAWSPDGKWLIFASDRGSEGNFELYVLPLTCLQEASASVACETRLLPLTENLADDLNPAWAN